MNVYLCAILNYPDYMTRLEIDESTFQIINYSLGYFLEEELIEEIIKIGLLKNVSTDELILNVGDA